MQQHAADYQKQNIPIFAICPEPVPLLADFVDRNHITYTMLSDSGSEVIRLVGILDQGIPEPDPHYGIPHPGSYLVDEKGYVFEKRFHPDVHVREPMGSLLLYFQLREYSERLEQKVEERTRQLEQAQLHLIETAKLATLVKLIAAINHELNTPLGALANGIDMLFKHLERSGERLTPRERASLEEIQRAVEIACNRITQVVANLREFVRLDQAETQTIDLRHSLDAVLELLAPQLDGRIRVSREYAEIPAVKGKAPQIHQALFEVLSNAVEAIPSDGIITVRTRRDGDEIVLSVTDTGRGIPPDELNQLFEPHLRPKDGRIGVSLGLPLAHKIIHEHGGRIEAYSPPGRGATVSIHLPAR